MKIESLREVKAELKIVKDLALDRSVVITKNGPPLRGASPSDISLRSGL